MSASSSTIRIVGLAAKRRSEPDSTTGVLRADYRCVNSRFRATLSRPAATSKLSRGHALEDELHLKAHVVAVAQRADLPRRRAVDARVVEDEAERIADVRDAGLVQDGALPVVEQGVGGDDAAAAVGGRDEQRVEELGVLEVEEWGAADPPHWGAADPGPH